MASNNDVRYELQVEGMTCVKCAQSIERVLKKHDPPASNMRIDFITNKVVFSLPTKDPLQSVIKAIEEDGYDVKKVTDLTQSNDNNKRVIRLKVLQGDKSQIIETINTGVSGVLEETTVLGNIATITYNPMYIRGTELINMLKELPEYQKGELIFQIENPFEDDEEVKFSSYTASQVIICLLCMLSVVASSMIPEHMTMVPMSWGVASYYMIFTLLMTAIIMVVVGASIFKICFQQLYTNFNVNMITLISVGSGFAFIFGAIYFTVGLFRTFSGNLDNMDYYIMNASQHLQTSAAIFTSVVAGKYVQGQIKKRIFNRITQLKASMKVKISTVTRIIPKNSDLEALSVEELHPALIERDDLVKVIPGMLPFDGFVEKGVIKVVENAQFGWEATESRSQGHRVISGSTVIDVEDEPIIRVTEPLEQTLAGKLFLEIKETTSGTSSEGTTNDIVSRFTKCFIVSTFAIAGITLVFWLVAMWFDLADFKITISYPFEKAIAVLVASCPCALGTAIPMVYVIALRKALNSGVLVKESSSLDQLNGVDAVVFDKTGTITGTYNLGETLPIDRKYDEATVWELVSVMEREHLQHPIGLALYQESLKRLEQAGKPKFKVSKDKNETSSHQYFGSEGIIDEGIEIDGKKRTIALGNEKLLSRLGLSDQILGLDTPKNKAAHFEHGNDNKDIDDIYSSVHTDETAEDCCSKKNKEKKGCCAPKEETKPAEEVDDDPYGFWKNKPEEEDEVEDCCSKNKGQNKEDCCASKSKTGGCCDNEKEIASCCVSKAVEKELESKPMLATEENNLVLKLRTPGEEEKKAEVGSNKIVLYLIIEDRVIFRLTLNLQETIKDNVHNLITGLKRYNKEIHLLTGDRRDNALETADILGIPKANVMAEVTPYEKEEYIRHLVNKKKKKVMMVGDGINDIKAFKEATVSCTINFKSSQNLSFSDFVIIDNDVENISALFKLGSAVDFFKKLILFASIAYNVPVIMAASGVTMMLFGFDLPAFMAAWTMFLSSVLLTLLSNGIECINLKKRVKKKVKDSGIKVDIKKEGYVQF